MAKNQQQKRLEAQQRQHQYLLTVAIPAWQQALEQRQDPEFLALVENRLIRSAHTANCDRRGNLLDHQFYATEPFPYPIPTPQACIGRYKLLSLDALKQFQTYGGRTLYDRAYGRNAF